MDNYYLINYLEELEGRINDDSFKIEDSDKKEEVKKAIENCNFKLNAGMHGRDEKTQFGDISIVSDKAEEFKKDFQFIYDNTDMSEDLDLEGLGLGIDSSSSSDDDESGDDSTSDENEDESEINKINNAVNGEDGGEDSDSTNDENEDETEEEVDENSREIDKINKLINEGGNSLSEEEINNLKEQINEIDSEISKNEAEIERLLSNIKNNEKIKNKVDRRFELYSSLRRDEPATPEMYENNNNAMIKYLTGVMEEEKLGDASIREKATQMRAILIAGNDSDNIGKCIAIGYYNIPYMRLNEFMNLSNDLGLNFVLSEADRDAFQRDQLIYLHSNDEIVKYFGDSKLANYESMKERKEVFATMVTPTNEDDYTKNNATLIEYLTKLGKTVGEDGRNANTLLGIIRSGNEIESFNECTKDGFFRIPTDRLNEAKELFNKLGLNSYVYNNSFDNKRIEELRAKNEELRNKKKELEDKINSKVGLDTLKEIQNAYNKIIEDVVNDANENKDLDNSNVDEFIKNNAENHELYPVLDKWKNSEKLKKELLEDIKKKVKIKGNDKTKGNGKEVTDGNRWGKILAGAAGFAAGAVTHIALGATPYGIGISIVLGARGLYQTAKWGCNVITKINNGNEPKFITSIKNHIDKHPKFKAVVDKILDSPKNPYARWFINGMSMGYYVDAFINKMGGTDKAVREKFSNLFNDNNPSKGSVPTSTVTGNGNSVIEDTRLTNSSSTTNNSSIVDEHWDTRLTKSSKAPKVEHDANWWNKYYGKVNNVTPTSNVPTTGSFDFSKLSDIDLSSISQGYTYSGSNSPVNLITEAGKHLSFDKTNVVNGETWYHFLQSNGKGYGWFSESQLKEVLDAATKTASRGGR